MVDQYQLSGVDTDEADLGLKNLTTRIKSTWPPTGQGQVLLDIGYYANVVNVGGQGIAITTDGVGSKSIIATAMNKYDTIGIDCIAMNVNDLICVGATPMSMVDYIAIDHVDSKILDEIAIGLCVGAKKSNISISGGEISQLPDVVNGFDLSGTAIGHVAIDRILVGKNVQPGDIVIGIESNGIHSNGLSLVRNTFFSLFKYKLTHKFDELDCRLGEELIKPTHIYVNEALDIMASIRSIKAFAHITSDGFLNLSRVAADVGFVIDSLPEIPSIFKIIQELGDIEYSEMFSVFNMGVGFCVIVDSNEVDNTIKLINNQGKNAQVIGFVTDDKSKTVSIPKYHLVGANKHFKYEGV